MSEAAAKPDFVLQGLLPGLEGRRELIVEANMTAHSMEAEGLHVLATPRLGMELEMACVHAIEHLLPETMITVGSELNFKHLTGSPIGARVVCTARLESVQGRRLLFKVQARDNFDEAADGYHERFIADRDWLFARIARKQARLLTEQSDQPVEAK
jgi:fluoroacetyl-CoA thioesterase